MLRIVIRLALTAYLVYMVYHESGLWTALAIGLLSISNELNALIVSKLLDWYKEIKDVLRL